GQLDAAVKRNRQAQSDFLTDMTEREREVAALVADGHSNRSIAERLVVSQSTARFHVSNILRKLQLTSRAEVAKVYNTGALANAGRVSSSKLFQTAPPRLLKLLGVRPCISVPNAVCRRSAQQVRATC